jgi:hypothetical protein
MGGMMSSFIDPIRLGLEESVRKVTVRVIWDEHGRPNQTFEVVQYLTDPSKLLLGPGANGTAGTPGTTGTTGKPGGTGSPLSGLGNIQQMLGGLH